MAPTLGPMNIDRPIIEHFAGELAYLDSYAGLVPIRVTEVRTITGCGNVPFVVCTIKVTADRGPYRRGELLTSATLWVIPRRSVRRNGAFYRIIHDYAWQEV